VLADRNVRVRERQAFAAYGVETDERGRFELPVPTETELRVVAMRGDLGWSAITEVAAGDAPVEVELVIQVSGELTGTVRRGGEPVEAQVRLSLLAGEPTSTLEENTPPDGRYRFAPVPPGTYEVRAALDERFTGGMAWPGKAEVTVVAAQTAVQDFDLEVGALLAVRAEVPPGQSLVTIEYTLLAGTALPATAAELARMTGKQGSLLFGGSDTHPIAQFHDRLAGSYVVCAEARREDDARLFGCAAVELAADEQSDEAVIDLRSAPPAP
jgi:hypothetical protein